MRLPAGYIDQFMAGNQIFLFFSQRTGLLMNKTHLITGGSPQHYDPTGSTPLTCCAVKLKRSSRKAAGQL